MGGSSDEKLCERHVRDLEAFVLRARRVAEHTLAQDMERLVSLASEQKIELDRSTNTYWMIRDLPPEELVESAAARVRPILLQDDPVHWGKALNAIRFLTKDFDERTEVIKITDSLKSDWNKVNPKGGAARSITKIIHERENEEPSVATDATLSTAWFYGDVVHAKSEERQRAKGFRIVDRYESATRTVAHAMLLTIGTLNYIQQLRQQGLLNSLAQEVFAEDVVVREPQKRLPMTGFYSAPAGTTMPENLDELPPEWQKVGSQPGDETDSGM